MHWFPRESKPLLLLLFLAFVLRVAVLWWYSDHLFEDRDGYRAIASGLADGRGYVNEVTGAPTAFRPPLYPVVLGLVKSVGGDERAIAMLHLLLGTATVLLTYVIGRNLNLGRASYAAALLVAFDPLLLQYTTFPMTETLCVFLVTLLLAQATARHPNSNGSAALHSLSLGAVFGLCALCRPTIWALGGLACLWWCWMWVRKRTVHQRRVKPGLVALAAVAIVSPWLIRNMAVMGHPIFTTTHGGYTLLLGNNRVFYEQVVRQPLGTVWDDAPPRQTQSDWYEELRDDWERDLGPNADETQRDRWMYHRAEQNISADLGGFARAVGLRCIRFWNISPASPATGRVGPMIVWSIRVFYAGITLAFVAGLVQTIRKKRRDFSPVLLVIVSFWLVHLLFWTNMRMRAPLIPSIALVCVLGLGCSPSPAEAAHDDDSLR